MRDQLLTAVCVAPAKRTLFQQQGAGWSRKGRRWGSGKILQAPRKVDQTLGSRDCDWWIETERPLASTTMGLDWL